MNPIKTAAMIAAIAAAYVVSGRLGLLLAIPPGYATAIFPAAGVALAAALLYGRPALTAVWLGSFMMNLWVGLDAGEEVRWTALPIPTLIAFGATLQAFSGAELMRRWVGFPSALDDERDILKFIVLSGALACLIGASVGNATLWYFGTLTSSNFASNWANWWIGDVIGVLIVTPVMLAFLMRPSGLWRNRRLALTVPLAVAVTLVVAGYVIASQWEQKRIEAELSYRANTLGEELEHGAQEQVALLSWVAHFYENSQQVERAEFHRFVTPVLDAGTGIKSLAWLPLVLENQRDRFEAQVRSEGFPEYQIKERNVQQHWLPSATRAEYFPVTYVEPALGNEIVLGYDIASDPVARAALEQARSTGGPAATPPVRLMQRNSNEPGWEISVFFPVDKYFSARKSTGPPVASLLGFAVAVIQLDDLAEMVSHRSQRGLFTVVLTDLSVPGIGQVIYSSDPLAGPSKATVLSYLHTFYFAGRQWQVRYAATPAYSQQNPGWRPWVVLAGGLIFTSVLEIFLLSMTGRASRVARLVEERTHELHQAHRIVNEAQRIAHLGYGIWDLQTNQETWSPEQARIFGFPSTQLTHAHEVYIQAIHPDDRENVVNAIHTALAVKNSYRAECRIHLSSGRSRHVVCEGEVERDAAGVPMRMVGVMLDVTENKRAEAEIIAAKEEALRANYAKSEFLSSMSHELRTPLNAVLGFTQLLSYDSQLAARHQATVAKIRTAGDHLLNLINDMLDLSRIEVGHVHLAMETVELDTLLNECRSWVQPAVDERGLRFMAPQCCTGIYVMADRTRLKQAVVNLLSNAVKYNCEQGEIKLYCETRDGNIYINVQDSGKGLSPEQQAQLFQPFNRLGQERGVIEGTGIGLIITKRLVELMNGELSVLSGVDQGSTFSIELLQIPAPLYAPPSVQSITTPRPLKSWSGAFAVLCVEDNPANMELVQVLVTSIWPMASFLRASSAEEGLDIAFNQPVDVILLDINLPGMDGYVALEKLKAHPRTAQVPVLALTANAMPEDIRCGKAAGFAAYLTKPLNMALLIGIVNTLLEQRPVTLAAAQRILIAEDNPVNQEILRAMVQALGYQVDIVDTGTAALDEVQKNSYAMVLMDCEMSHMNGYEATHAIRQLPGSVAKIPIIAVSAYAAAEDAEQRIQAGMTDVLAKPVNIEQLKCVLARHVQAI